MLLPVSMEPVWRCTSSCPGPYPPAAIPEFQIGCTLGRELFTFPSYVLLLLLLLILLLLLLLLLLLSLLLISRSMDLWKIRISYV
jgi:hypothetical protein